MFLCLLFDTCYLLCPAAWISFRNPQNRIYESIGEVVSRKLRKKALNIKISYHPAPDEAGPSGNLYLPQSTKIKVFGIRATHLRRVPDCEVSTTICAAEDADDTDHGCDLGPLPSFSQIDPTFSVHVVAIFRSIIRDYPRLKLSSEKDALWQKFLNAPRDSLVSVRKAIQRRESIPHSHKSANAKENVFLSKEEVKELEVDRRSIRNALHAARAGNLSKATRVLDNVYVDSQLSVEKVRKLKDLHPTGDPPPASSVEYPRAGVIEMDEVRSAVNKLAHGAAPGPTGLSENILRLLADDVVCCSGLCHMIRDVINGEISTSVRNRLTLIVHVLKFSRGAVMYLPAGPSGHIVSSNYDLYSEFYMGWVFTIILYILVRLLFTSL